MDRINVHGFMAPADKELKQTCSDKARRVAAALGERVVLEASKAADRCYLPPLRTFKDEWRQCDHPHLNPVDRQHDRL